MRPAIIDGTDDHFFQLCCQPLDTIKVRMQLSRSGRAPGACILHYLVAIERSNDE